MATIFEQKPPVFCKCQKGPKGFYGIDECRFTNQFTWPPLEWRFTCKEKIEQEKKECWRYCQGIVKWLVDVFDETGDTVVAIATIPTHGKKCQD